MRKLFRIIVHFFKIKCPECRNIMKEVSEWQGSIVYGCTECKKEWF